MNSKDEIKKRRNTIEANNSSEPLNIEIDVGVTIFNSNIRKQRNEKLNERPQNHFKLKK